jgi:peptidoglycan/LPS O-acetylase OafA/YrhL
MQGQTIHFPGLNNLRFLAALSVLVFHVEDKKRLLGLNTHWLNRLTVVGDLGVTLFFVLSGFLITYLLLAEKQKAKTISIKKFYLRRILRIWPLYYLILILGFFVLPHIGLFQINNTSLIDIGNFTQLLLFFLFFANIGFSVYGNLPYIDQTWSVAVEEQFYLLWPVILKYVRNILPVLLLIIFAFVSARAFVGSMYLQGDLYRKAYSFLYYLRIDNMAVGAVFAWLLFNKKEDILRPIFSKTIQIITIVLLLALCLHGYVIPYIHHLSYAILFGIVIINAANGSALFTIKFKALDYFGKISYGVYMYHNIPIVAVLKFCAGFLLPDTVLFFVASHLLSLALTLLVAHFSFRYFEKYFLSFKQQYAVINSAD